MTLTLPPRFIDTIEVQAAPPKSPNNPAGWAQVMSNGFGTTNDVSQAYELTRRFKYWNYVAIHRMAERMAQTMPSVGYPIELKGTPKMSQSMRTWLGDRYGWQNLVSTDRDINPVPLTHPFMALLNRLNPRDTWHAFIYDTVVQWELTGRFYWWAVPNGFGLPVELWLIPTCWVNRVFDQNGLLSKYEILPQRSRWKERFIPVEEMICEEYRSPLDPNEPWSSLRAAPLWSEALENMEKSRSAHFRNGVHPDLIVHLDRAVFGDPGDDTLKRIKERLIQRTAGVERTGEPYIVPGGAKVEKWSNTPKEMDYGDSATQMRDNELAKTGTPAVVAGVSRDYNRDTAESAFEVWCEVILNPKFRRLAGVFQRLARLFDERILVYYPDCRPRNAEMRLKELTSGMDRGAIWPNEYRQEVGLPRLDLPGYDEGYLPASMQPISQAAMPIDAKPIPAEEEDDEDTPPAKKPPKPADDDEVDDEDDADE